MLAFKYHVVPLIKLKIIWVGFFSEALAPPSKIEWSAITLASPLSSSFGLPAKRILARTSESLSVIFDCFPRTASPLLFVRTRAHNRSICPPHVAKRADFCPVLISFPPLMVIFDCFSCAWSPISLVFITTSLSSICPPDPANAAALIPVVVSVPLFMTIFDCSACACSPILCTCMGTSVRSICPPDPANTAGFKPVVVIDPLIMVIFDCAYCAWRPCVVNGGSFVSNFCVCMPLSRVCTTTSVSLISPPSPARTAGCNPAVISFPPCIVIFDCRSFAESPWSFDKTSTLSFSVITLSFSALIPI